ncbi:hypothetical protein [Longimicrobium terrae]|uniref:Ferritin-like domain-containing protein n=1 Tax=Longimicrobium terrae TaxID=1639882 RepID=A0A841H084_9BACT|nr:hypothetical protein [Longimicrobium terrae]MBB4636975.1 hypothetical protein [Longimicrobium terrae]MBB6071417.1 hypothetical protein [Longimicrobium terrae]
MSVEALLNTQISSGRVALAARVALSQCSPDTECPIYLEALDQALEDEPPPYDTSVYADIYEKAALSGRWMAVSLITNAEREGDGAKRLWSLAACSPEPTVQHQLKCHAVDESRHALLYLALLDLTFPGAADPAFRTDLNRLSPKFALKHDLYPVPGSPYAKKATIDDFLQMNIAEIRTTIHHIMQRPAISMHCSPDAHTKVASIQNSLLRDELKHVAYTAVLIEQIARELPRERVNALFRKRVGDFNRITYSELGGTGLFDCSVACCARNPSCRATSQEHVVPATSNFAAPGLPVLN